MYFLNKLLCVFLINGIAKIWSQEFSDEEDENAVDKNNFFIDPQHMSDEADIFVFEKTEYLFLNIKMPYHVAAVVCNENYGAELAFVKDFALADFLAEALSETSLILDALWLGAKKEINSSDWYWIRGDSFEKIEQEIVDEFVYNYHVEALDRFCLTFGRLDHDVPQFRPIECNVNRAAMCEREKGRGHHNTTHEGWIKFGKRYYKIYDEPVDWDTAVSRCFDYDSAATLAVITSFKVCQLLGRYLLIGRPSLENAWIDGKFIEDNYIFEQERMVLANESDATGFPPWRKGKMQKPGGCLLLDRHVSNITLFVEARCSRQRPFICYKVISDDGRPTTSDIIIDKHGYRIVYLKLKWDDANNFCKDKYGNYSSVMAEIREKVQVYHLLYAMGENKTALQHIWLAGRYNVTLNPKQWLWQSDLEVIPIGPDSFLHWIHNRTYTHSVEKNNLCLKMDRENHIVALHYGAACAAELYFICHFTAEELRRLQRDEMAHSNDTASH